jgi:hypothetical protein
VVDQFSVYLVLLCDFFGAFDIEFV